MELHVLFGPTATSKTKMAQALWKRYGYPILSVDSRKVYRGADIGTNKLEILAFKKENPNVLFGGIDFLEPNEEVSVYVYQQYVYKWISEHSTEIEKAGGLIIHGGTGLYLDAILEGKSLLGQKDSVLRESLEKMSLEELQKEADKVNTERYSKLNDSDRMNPRRLIRVIENQGVEEKIIDTKEANLLRNAVKVWHFNLPKREQLYKTINARVYRYFAEGWFQEILSLLEKFDATSPALQMMGYKQVVSFMTDNENWRQLVDQNTPEFQEVIATIQQEHRHYAKRQETWAKKYF